MRRRSLLMVPVAGVLAGRARAQGAALPVVATFSVLGDLVAQVGGDRVVVALLVGPGADVHAFQPRPGDVARVRDAAVLVENGLGLEGWLTRLVRSSGFKGRLVTAASGVKARSLVQGGKSAQDPHAWQDPRQARTMVAAIASGLAAADPANAAWYAERAGAYVAEIGRADAEIAAAVAAVPEAKRKVITTHDAFGYFGARYGIEFRAAQRLSTAAEPSPRDMARLAQQIRRDGIRAVFVESMTDPRLAATLARESGAVVGPAVYSDSLSPPGGPAATYLAMLRHNTAAFIAAMGAQ